MCVVCFPPLPHRASSAQTSTLHFARMSFAGAPTLSFLWQGHTVAVQSVSTPHPGRLVQESCLQCLVRQMLTTLSRACCLQYAAVLVPIKIWLGAVLQVSCEQRLPWIKTMPFSERCVQYEGVLLPSTLNLGSFVNEAREQDLLTSFIMPS